MIVEKMLELVNQKSTLCIGGGEFHQENMLSEGKNTEKNNSSPLLKQAKMKEKKSIHFSNCREKK